MAKESAGHPPMMAIPTATMTTPEFVRTVRRERIDPQGQEAGEETRWRY